MKEDNNSFTPDNFSNDGISFSDIKNEVEETKNKVLRKSNTVLPFPADAFPLKIQEIMGEFQKSFQLPIDYFGLGILTTAASVIGNAYVLEFKYGHLVPPIIYAALVGPSSIGKTPALKKCLAPIYKLEANYYKDYQKKLAEWEEEKATCKKDEQPPKPIAEEIIINDATTEAIKKALGNNPKGLLLFQDELIAWINSLNQYRSGSDTEFWLSNWNNAFAKVSRSTQETVYVPKPSIPVIGGIQPSILEELAKGSRKNNGFLFRMLFAFPIKVKKPYTNDYQISPDIVNSYDNIINQLHQLPNKIKLDEVTNSWTIDPIKINLSKNAKAIFLVWDNSNTDAINATEDDSIKAMLGKLSNYCLRFSLIIELLDAVCNGKTISEVYTDITEKTMENAIRLTEYFKSTSLHVLSIINNDDPFRGLSDSKRKIYALLPDEFKTRDGLIIALKSGMSESTFKRFLKEKSLFKRELQGLYYKLY